MFLCSQYRYILTVLCICLISLCSSVPINQFFEFANSTHDRSLDKGDDISSKEIHLKTPIHFYNKKYSSLFINSNGHISFETELPIYQPNLILPIGYKVIAAYLADIDTSRKGVILYRETNDSFVLKHAAEYVKNHFIDFHDFRPLTAFIVTWFQVGHYKENSENLNTFQLALITGKETTFAVFNYLSNGLSWVRGDGKMSPQQNDSYAQMGFDSGERNQNFIHRLSGKISAKHLSSKSNVDIPGVWIYNIGGKNVKGPDFSPGEVYVLNVDKHNKSCVEGARICSPEGARCIDYKNGFCCSCDKPFYGNGITCFEEGKAQSLSGSVNLYMNGDTLHDVGEHSYVVTSDGRTYTAISRIPPKYGHVLQALNTLGGIVGWLFALATKPGIKNGFMITGGKFNRTAVVHFQSGEKVTVHQEFRVHNDIRSSTTIRGRLPSLPPQAKITNDDFTEVYKRTAPGTIKSYTRRTYRVNRKPLVYTLDQTITYDECQFDQSFAKMPDMKLVVTRSFVMYQSRQNIVRFASTNKIGPLADVNYCARATSVCGANADCFTEGTSYKCKCRPGFLGDGQVCADINECRTTAPCSHNAECRNTEGSFICRCLPGFQGDGRTCERKLCGQLRCDPNARCVYDSIRKMPICECHSGFAGNGTLCRKSNRKACGEYLCHSEARCVYSSDLKKPICECNRDFTGNGTFCFKADFSCNEVNNCNENAECVFDREERRYRCVCQDGFSGDGIESCEEKLNCQSCDTNAECQYDVNRLIYRCQCKNGYTGDGKTCYPITIRFKITIYTGKKPNSGTDAKLSLILHGVNGQSHTINIVTDKDKVLETGQVDIFIINARDVGELQRLHVEHDNTGDNPAWFLHKITIENLDYQQKYEFLADIWFDRNSGDRLIARDFRARPINAECERCNQNARCLYDQDSKSYKCRCARGYRGDGYRCQPVDCSLLRDCSPNGRCVRHSQTGHHHCICNPGFRGDGRSCERLPCNVARNCDRHAECRQDPRNDRRFVCVCKPGYTGDGYRCLQSTPSCNQVNNCNENAECLYDPDRQSYSCVCKRGYHGDGLRCQRIELDCRRDPSLCDRNARCAVREQRYVCVCNTGFYGDGRLCRNIEGSSNYIAVAQGSSILQMPYNNDVSENMKPKLVVFQPGELIIGLGYNCKDKSIYWTEANSKTIKNAFVNGSSVHTVLSGLGLPEGIAVDWLAENIYWTDSELAHIEVARLNGTNRKVVINSNLTNPRSIVLDPAEGMMYWTDWNRIAPKIEKAYMDGSQRSVLVSESLTLPNALTLDIWTRNLCWGDAGTQKIECIKTDGSGRTTVYDVASYPFSLTVAGRRLFWTDWNMKSIPNIKLAGGNAGKPLALPHGGHGKLYGITTVTSDCPRINNACSLNNGGCTHLCLPTHHGGRTCACPDDVSPGKCEILVLKETNTRN